MPAETREQRQERLRAAGTWLRDQRQRRGWSGSELARRLGVNQVRVSAYERGRYEVPADLTGRVAEVLALPHIEVRRGLGHWVPADDERGQLRGYSDPAALPDEALMGELLRRYQAVTEQEVVGTFGHRSDVPPTLWERLLRSASTEIVLADYTAPLPADDPADLSGQLRARAEAGLPVRILIGDPDHAVTRRRDAEQPEQPSVRAAIAQTMHDLADLARVPGAQVRLTDADADLHLSRSVFRFDGEALVSEHIADRDGYGSLTYHLRRLHRDGPFDKYLGHVERLWEGAHPWSPPDP